jgi:hypothetical protein
MVEQIESVVKPEAHGTHHLQAVKPGCQDPAAVAGLGRLRGLLAQRTNETHGPRIKAFGGSVDTHHRCYRHVSGE